MNIEFDEGRAAAWRTALIDRVSDARPRHRLLISGALILVGALGGAGATTAAFASTGAIGGWMYPAIPGGQPAPDYGSAVDAPAGVIPGSPVIALLGSVRMIEISAPTVLPLDDTPASATHLRVTVVGREPGTLSFGTDPSENNPSAGWSASDIAEDTASTSFDFPLDADQHALYLTPSTGAAAFVTTQYVTHVPTRLGINEHGHTYGVDGPAGAPDLIAVSGIDPDGELVDGYAWREQLFAFSPDSGPGPSDPKEAQEMQTDRDSTYPDGWDIPVYDSDGTTQIGTFRVG